MSPPGAASPGPRRSRPGCGAQAAAAARPLGALTLVAPALVALTLVALAAAPAPARAARVAGAVVDRAGRPVEFATVSVPALKLGAATDAEGRFALEIPDGPARLVVQQLGYEPRRIDVTVAPGLAALRVVLEEAPVELTEVSVSTSAFGKVGSGEGATLRRMQVYTTPGGAADVFQALRTMPGLAAPSEGAALYVRGGPPSETLVRLDGGDLGHPYHYESAGGGLFSALDPYMVKSAFFSSGGFSARYGGAISGLLDIETQDPMNLRTVSLGANLAGGGGSTTWALVRDRLSLVTAWRRGDPSLLLKLHGSPNEYSVEPSSRDFASRLLWRYSGSGRLALLAIDGTDRTSLWAHHLGYRLPASQESRSTLGAIQLRDAIGGALAVRGQVSGQRYERDAGIGDFTTATDERNAQANVEAVWAASPRHELAFGASLKRRDTEITGTAPADSIDFGAGAPVRRLDGHPIDTSPGAFVEDKMRVWGPIYATLGVRLDRAPGPPVWTVDPRGALAWRADDRQTVRIAAGRYHQLPEPAFLDPVYGNPRLGPVRADHLIAGYEWLDDRTNLRVEAFRKEYRDVVTNDAATFYANGGHGRAQGVDVFVQGGVRWLTGWVSYGFLDSRRKEGSNPREVPSAHGVRHSVSVVGTYQLTSSLHLGARYGFSSGRAYTPVVGATYDAARGIWRPIHAEDNSGTMPDYHRLDARIMQLFSIPAGLGLPASGVCVAYLEALNVLDTANVLEYDYTADYRQRIAQESVFGRRLLVFGVALTW